MATATQPQNEISIEAAEDRLWDAFAEHLDTLTPEKRHEVLDNLSEMAREIELKSKTTA